MVGQERRYKHLVYALIALPLILWVGSMHHNQHQPTMVMSNPLDMSTYNVSRGISTDTPSPPVVPPNPSSPTQPAHHQHITKETQTVSGQLNKLPNGMLQNFNDTPRLSHGTHQLSNSPMFTPRPSKPLDSFPRDLSWVTGEVVASGKVRRKPMSGLPNATAQSSCMEKTNLVYIKMIKCASQTLVNLFRRFGLERRLSFVTTLGTKWYLGWPWPLQENFYRPSKTGHFNILCDHSILDETVMSRIMPSDTVYITSLREPFAQFKSMFNYYKFARILHLSSPDPLAEFLLDQARYEAEYVSSSKRNCVPNGFHMSRNLMAYNLGFPTGFLEDRPDQSTNQTYIQSFLGYLDRKLDLVLLVEYFHESLILLKRKMCWQLSDVIYLSKNVGSYTYKRDVNTTLVDIYRRWSAVDYQLYDHLNESFWRQVRDQSPDFTAEVAHFSDVTRDISSFCREVEQHGAGGYSLFILGTPWSKPLEVTGPDCGTLNRELMTRVHTLWDITYPDMPQPTPDKSFC